MNTAQLMRSTVTAALAVALLWSGPQAHAQIDGGVFAPQFAVGATWIGFVQSSVNPNVRGLSTLLVTSQVGSQFSGQFLFNGQATAYVGAVGADGSLVLKGTGRTGFQATGAATVLGDGGFAARFAYKFGSTGDAGMVRLLHRFAYDPSLQAFPPGPCVGQFTSVDGATGAMQFQRTDSTADSARTTSFHGSLTFGAWTYNAAGTISPLMNRDGSYSFDIIGQPATVIPCIMPPDIQLVGRYFPASAAGGPSTITGNYLCIDHNTAGSPIQSGNFALIGL